MYTHALSDAVYFLFGLIYYSFPYFLTWNLSPALCLGIRASVASTRMQELQISPAKKLFWISLLELFILPATIFQALCHPQG